MAPTTNPSPALRAPDAPVPAAAAGPGVAAPSLRAPPAPAPAEPPGFDEGEPVGPTAADEADLRDQGVVLERYAPPGAATENTAALPRLDALIARISPATRAALDEHLRARFVRVKKLKPGELK